MSHAAAMRIAVILAMVVSSAARADEATDLRDRVLAAYAATQTYQADVTFEVVQKEGRWRLTQQFRVAFDRSGNKLLIDRPDLLVVSDGARLFVRSDQIPGRHLAVSAPQPLKFAALLQQAPFLQHPPLPDVAFLLGSDPTAFSATLQKMGADPNDMQGREQLGLRTPEGEVRYRIDATRNLITGAVWRMGDLNVSPLQHEPMTLKVEINILRHNDQFNEDMFVFDEANSQPAGSIEDLVTADTSDASKMEGKTAPSIDLNTHEGRAWALKNVSAEVVVLEFWASWVVPTHRSLVVMQSLQDWGDQESKSIAVVGVNMQEKQQDVSDFWAWKKFSFPTVLDVDGKVSRAYQVGPLPHRVVIHQGKIKKVLVGEQPNPEAMLKKIIEELLAGQMAEGKSEAKP